ncbi:MAG: class I SAM-dependent methyltransferase [Thermodesulfobacteriota bacterium]
MKNHLSWQYDEFKQVGKDYADGEEASNYDARHADFRDMEAESNKVLDTLGLKMGDLLIDFGAGTGTFAIQAARRGARVFAVDVSQAMIAQAQSKAAGAGQDSIEFHQAGFLTYSHEEQPVDAIITTFAFHHLPDFWKGIALQRLNRMLKPAGQLFIHDVIIEEANSLENISALIDRLSAAGGDFLKEDAEGHFREEYSTYDWVMDGLLARSGFTINSKEMDGGVIGTYLCRKN